MAGACPEQGLSGTRGVWGGSPGAVGGGPASARSLTLLSRSEPIQSRCAVLRYTKLSDAQVLARLLAVLEQEKVPYTDDGLEAVIFTAQGDMRQVRAAEAPRPPTSGAACALFWGGRCAETGTPLTGADPGGGGSGRTPVLGAVAMVRTENRHPRVLVSSAGAEQRAVDLLGIRLY